jgi:hypothetical protein
MGERTGSRIFHYLWSYVLHRSLSSVYILTFNSKYIHQTLLILLQIGPARHGTIVLIAVKQLFRQSQTHAMRLTISLDTLPHHSIVFNVLEVQERRPWRLFSLVIGLFCLYHEAYRHCLVPQFPNSTCRFFGEEEHGHVDGGNGEVERTLPYPQDTLG